MTVKEEIKKEKLIIYIIGTVIGLVLTIGSTFYLPDTFIDEEGLKQIINFLQLNLCGEAFLCIFGVLAGHELITYLIGKKLKSKMLKWIILIFIMIMFLDKCPSALFRNYNSHIGNDNFFGIYFFEDLKMLSDCKKDLREKEVNTLYEVGYNKEQYVSYSPKHVETYLYLYEGANRKDFIDYTCIKLEDYKKIEEKFNEKNISEIKLYKNTNLICSMK
ncbi:MAG: hypothetical protein IKT41_05220 [Clostridia bacterium]|nr:hypothetical protein [Clostridia bacterium]